MNLARVSGFVAATWTLFVLACAPAVAPSAGVATEGDWKTRWDQTLLEAKKEGNVVVNTNTSLFYRETLDKFQEKYPDIKVEHVAMRPSEFAPKVVTEQQNGLFNYDAMISSTGNMVEVMLPAGSFEKITPSLILPEVTEGSNWRGGQLLYGSYEPYIALNRGNVSGDVVVNRNVVSKAQFSNIDQLWDPKFKGQITIRNPSAPHNASLFLSGVLHAKGEEAVWKLLWDQQPVYTENARLLSENVIRGKYGIALGIETAAFENCRTAGACNHMEEIAGPRHMLGHGGAVIKNAPHPAAAAVMINWYFSREGQEAFKQAIINNNPAPFVDAHSARVDVEPHPDAVKAGNVPDYSNLKQYSLQGMEQGAGEMKKVIELWNKVEAQRP